jgi:hypothetical protein
MALLFQFVVVVTVLAFNLLVVSLAVLLRLLPMIAPAVPRLVRDGLMLSRRFYKLVLARAAPPIKRRTGIDILVGAWRVAAAVVLSLALGLFVSMMIPVPIGRLSIIMFIIHGLAVVVVWDQEPGEPAFRIGEDL